MTAQNLKMLYLILMLILQVLGYKLTFGNTIFKYIPINLKTTIGIGRLKEFNDEVIKINNADYDN